MRPDEYKSFMDSPLFYYRDPFETTEERLQRKIDSLEKELEKNKVKLPTKYIINKDATILFFEDGTKTVVKRSADDEFNPRLAFLTAFFQHYSNLSKNKANKYLASLQVEGNKKYEKVIDTYEYFDYYYKWIKRNFPQFIDYFELGDTPTQHKTYEIIGKAKHENKSEGILCLIQDPKTKQVFIMSENAIKEEK